MRKATDSGIENVVYLLFPYALPMPCNFKTPDSFLTILRIVAGEKCHMLANSDGV